MTGPRSGGAPEPLCGGLPAECLIGLLPEHEANIYFVKFLKFQGSSQSFISSFTLQMLNISLGPDLENVRVPFMIFREYNHILRKILKEKLYFICFSLWRGVGREREEAGEGKEKGEGV